MYTGHDVEKRYLFELNDFSTNTNKWRVDNPTGPVQYVLRDGGFVETRFEIPETVIANASTYRPVLSVGYAIDSWTSANAIHFYLSGKANTTDMVTVSVHSNNQNMYISVPAKAGDKMTIRLSSAGVFINGEAYGSTNIQAALEQVTGLASLNIGSVEGSNRFISQYDYVRIGRGS